MNVIKEHKINNRKKGQVTFGSKHGGTWLFLASDKKNKWEKAMKVPGGLPVAEKIAEVVSASWLRTAAKDGLRDDQRIDWRARTMIDKLIKLRTLKDYDDDPEWWHNVEGDEPSVKMNFINQPPPAKGISAEDLEVEPAKVLHDAFAQTEGEVIGLETHAA